MAHCYVELGYHKKGEETQMLEDKETYTLRELIENLPCSLRQFGKDHNISEVTIARVRDGKPAIRSTINKLLTALSSVYGKTLTLRNVRGISIRGEVQHEEGKSETEPSTEGKAGVEAA